jgi:hypothetical protein
MAQPIPPVVAADPTRPYRPPVIGSLDVQVQYIAGYHQRIRSSYGQEIVTMLTRFLEFATSRATGTMSYSFSEVPRFQGCEDGYPFELIVQGNNLPADLSSTRQALKMLLSGCPDMIFSNPMEDSGAGSMPNILFNSARAKFIQNLELCDSPAGFAIKGYYMLKRSSTRYFAYPFKVYIVRLTDSNIATFHNKTAFGGDWLPFLSEMLKYWDLSMTIDDAGTMDSTLSMKYDNENVFLTRGTALANFLPSFSSAMFSGIGADSIVNTIKVLRYCSSEAVIYAMGKLPTNQVTRGIQSYVSGNVVRGADYNYTSGSSVTDKKNNFKMWLIALLQQRSTGPRDPNQKWGLGYIAERERAKQSIGLVEDRIIAAIGKEVYDKLVTEQSKLSVLDSYMIRVEAKDLDFLHLSEGYLETDFLEFASEIGLPIPDDTPPA